MQRNYLILKTMRIATEPSPISPFQDKMEQNEYEDENGDDYNLEEFAAQL